MAREVYAFNVTIPAGTLSTAPWSPPLAIPQRRVTALEILVPPGPRGEVGFAIGASGNPVIPRAAGSWLITDNEQIHWPLENALDNGAWQFFGYNTGTYPHLIVVRFLCELNPDAPTTSAPLLDLAHLAGAPALAPTRVGDTPLGQLGFAVGPT